MASTVTTERPLLELKIQEQADGQVDASIPVRWVITPELVKQLKQAEFVAPHALVVVSHKTVDDYEDEVIWTDTYRDIVPLRDEMTYVSFSHPGVNRISVIILDGTYINRKFKAMLLCRNNSNRFDFFVFHDYDGEFECKLGAVSTFLQQDGSAPYAFEENVLVPESVFAKEPPAWMNRIVRKYNHGKDVDQCDFRGKAMISLPWFFLVDMTIGNAIRAIITIAALFCGIRGLAWSELHPIDGSLAGIWSYSQGSSRWFTKKDGNDRSFASLFLNPITLVLPAIIAFAVKRDIWWSLIGVAIGCGLATMLLFMIGLHYYFNEYRPDHKKESRYRDFTVSEKIEVFDELERMATWPVDKITADYKSLPRDKRTFHLFFLKTKKNVCKPYADR